MKITLYIISFPETNVIRLEYNLTYYYLTFLVLTIAKNLYNY